MTETTWEYTILDVSPLFSYTGNGYNSSGGPNSKIGWTQSGCMPPGACNPSSSIHQTSMSGAGVSLTFYGQSIQLFGNVTGGMQYVVNLDDGVSRPGTPSGQILLSLSTLKPGYHTIGVTAAPTSDDGVLTFQSARVTVGTGRTSAQVIRNIVQDDHASIQYSPNGWGTGLFSMWSIPYWTSNRTWHQLGSPGSYSLRFSGNAIMVYGFSWGFSPSVHKFTLDNDPPTTIFANSSLTMENTYSASGLAFIRANLSGSEHYLTVSNVGSGLMGLDYIEILNVTGGTKVGPGNSGHPISPGVIAGAVIGGILALGFIAFLLYKCIPKFIKTGKTGMGGERHPDIDARQGRGGEPD